MSTSGTATALSAVFRTKIGRLSPFASHLGLKEHENFQNMRRFYLNLHKSKKLFGQMIGTLAQVTLVRESPHNVFNSGFIWDLLGPELWLVTSPTKKVDNVWV